MTATKTDFAPMNPPTATLWGHPQDRIECLPGIWWVSTSSHGGYCVSSEREAAIPAHLNQGIYYEEDCDWALLHLAFPELNEAHSKDTDEIRKSVEKTVRDWHPTAYEKHFGRKLKPGESYINDQRQLQHQNRNRWVVVSAFGSWHKNCPEGMVLVCATLGGKRTHGLEERWYLIPEKEYDDRTGSFVVVCRKHKRVDAPEGH